MNTPDETRGWDDIPSPDLDDLKVDWDFRPENPLGKRSSHRLVDRELVRVFGVLCIPVKIATVDAIAKGLLQDISENGVAVRLPRQLRLDERVKLGFFLGEAKMLCEGTVRHVSSGPLGVTCGIRLNGLPDDLKERIRDLYAPVTLK